MHRAIEDLRAAREAGVELSSESQLSRSCPPDAPGGLKDTEDAPTKISDTHSFDEALGEQLEDPESRAKWERAVLGGAVANASSGTASSGSSPSRVGEHQVAVRSGAQHGIVGGGA
jgi:hypothetical protein